MTITDTEKNPSFSFRFPTFEDWLEAARTELNGDNPLEKLKIKKGSLEILPFYQLNEQNQTTSALPRSNDYYGGARSWKNISEVNVTDEENANELALHYLNTGAEGILFTCTNGNPNLNKLLNAISLSDCAIAFQLSVESILTAQHFFEYATRFDTSKIRGFISCQNTDETTLEILKSFSEWENFYSICIHVIEKDDPVDTVAYALYDAVSVLQRQDNNHLIDQLCFRANIQTDFFLEIAKLKALRNLWYQVRGAYGALHEIKPLYIHGVSSRWVRDTYKPHGNMIKAATATMAAIAGGCDSVTVEPENPDNEMENRIARNVSSILREESHFSKVADPLTGSFYLEALTDQLSQKAWSKFQTLIHS